MFSREPRGKAERLTADQSLARLPGCTLTGLLVAGGALQFHFENSNGWGGSANISNDTAVGQASAVVGPPGSPQVVVAAMRLLHQDVTAARIENDGTLLLEVAGTPVTVGPHPEYEAYTLSLNNGAMYVCTAAGELAVWDAST